MFLMILKKYFLFSRNFFGEEKDFPSWFIQQGEGSYGCVGPLSKSAEGHYLI